MMRLELEEHVWNLDVARQKLTVSASVGDSRTSMGKGYMFQMLCCSVAGAM